MPTVVLRVGLWDCIWLDLTSKHERKGTQELDRKWSGGWVHSSFWSALAADCFV